MYMYFTWLHKLYMYLLSPRWTAWSLELEQIATHEIQFLSMDPNSSGPMYSAEQIRIPPELPDMLKEFTKDTIRTQPPDLLQWSAA